MRNLDDHSVDVPSISTYKLISSLYNCTSQLQNTEVLCVPLTSSNLVAQVSAAINELALRVIKISVSDRSRKARMQSCQQSLVALGSQFSPASTPDKMIAAADKLFEGTFDC